MRYPTSDDHYGPAGPKLNPWTSIWLRPRKTIRYILTNNPSYGFKLLIIAYGFVYFLEMAEDTSIADEVKNLEAIILAGLLIGPLLMVLITYLSAFLIHWTGKRLKGKAEQSELRVACAWSYLPMILPIILHIPRISIHGLALFTENFSETWPEILPKNLIALEFSYLGLIVVGGFWSLILMSNMVAEVQGYRTAWQGLWNCILPGLYILGIIMVLFGLAFIGRLLITGSMPI